MNNSNKTKEAEDLLSLVGQAVSPFHAVQAVGSQLMAAGFEELKWAEDWKTKKGGKYFVCHHGSSIVAFTVGSKEPLKGQLRIAAAHTDFPCLRIKTNPDMQEED